jgi:hypothetical protein
MMEGKKGLSIVPNKTTELILAVVVALCIFMIAGTIFGVLSNGKNDPYTCALNARFSSNSKVLGLANTLIEWECPIKGPVEITPDELKKRVNTRIIPPITTELYGGDEQLRMNGRAKYEYNVNTFVAKELRDCWIKSGYGGDIFDDSGLLETMQNLFEAEKIAPYSCGICTVFYFDEKAQQMLKGAPLNHVDFHLKFNPYQLGETQSFWEFLKMEEKRSNPIDKRAYVPNIGHFTFVPGSIDEPNVILFVRRNPLTSAKVLQTVEEIKENTPVVKWLNRGAKWLEKWAARGGRTVTRWFTDDEEMVQSLWPEPEQQKAAIKEAAEGNTFLVISDMHLVKEQCKLVLNSFSDKNLERVWE